MKAILLFYFRKDSFLNPLGKVLLSPFILFIALLGGLLLSKRVKKEMLEDL